MKALRHGLTIAVLRATFLFACPAMSAQQGPLPPQGQDLQSAPGQDSAASPANTNAERPATDSLDTGQTIDGHNRVLSPMRVGHFSVLSFSTYYVFDSNYAFQSTNPASNAYAARILLLYSIGNERSGLDIQYQPYLFVYQDSQQVSANVDSRLAVHAFHNLSDHWLFNLDEMFYYSPNSGNQIDPTIVANSATGSVSLVPFLGIGQEELYNHLVASLEDQLSAEDTLSFHVNYNYENLSNPYASGSVAPTSVQGFQTDSSVGGGIVWTHEWQQDQQIGLAYNYNHQILSNANAQEQYHSLLVSYSQRIRPTLLVRLSVGPSVQLHGNASPKTVTVIANASVLKTFRSSSLVLSYSRGYGFTGVPTDSYYERYDAFYSQNLHRRWVLSLGGGYIRQNSTVAAALSGYSAWAALEYYLSDRWSVVAQVANSALAGGLQPDASRYLVSAGLHWSPIRENGTQP